MRKILIAFSLIFVDIFAGELLIDLDSNKQISVTINKKTFINKTKIDISNFSKPIKVKVFEILNNKLILLNKQTLYSSNGVHKINNKETFISFILDKIVLNSTISAINIDSLKIEIEEKFNKEIREFLKSNKGSFEEKLEEVDLSKLKTKLSEIIDNHDKPIRSIHINNINNLAKHYVTTQELTIENRQPELKLISINNELKKYSDFFVSDNEKTLFTVYNNNKRKPLFVNYIGKYDDELEESKELEGLVNLYFDELLMRCSELHIGQRICYYFDLVEERIDSKEELFNIVIHNLPSKFESLGLKMKFITIKKVFNKTIEDIVKSNK